MRKRYELVFPDPDNRCLHPESMILHSPMPPISLVGLIDVVMFCNSCGEEVYPVIENDLIPEDSLAI